MTTRAPLVLKTQHMGPYLDWVLKLYLLLKCNLWWRYFLLPRAILPEMQLVQVWSFGHYFRHLYFNIYVIYITSSGLFYIITKLSFTILLATQLVKVLLLQKLQLNAWCGQNKTNVEEKWIWIQNVVCQKVEFPMYFVSFVRNWAKSGH